MSKEKLKFLIYSVFKFAKQKVLTVIAGRYIAQTFFQTLLIGTKTRGIRIIHITIESLFMQFKIIGFNAIQHARMRVHNGQSTTEGFAIDSKHFPFSHIAGKKSAIIGTLNTIAIGKTVSK